MTLEERGGVGDRCGEPRSWALGQLGVPLERAAGAALAKRRPRRQQAGR
jgi:hypothetical protein